MSVRPLRSWLWLLFVAAAIVFLSVFSPPKTTLLREALLDAGHAPLFGVVAVALLRFLSPPGTCARRPYLRAWMLTVVLGAATEGAQFFGPRDADPLDLARNVAGATAFLLIAAVFDGQKRKRGPLIAAAFALLGAASFPAAATAVDYLRRDAAFPILCDFESAWTLRFAGVSDAEMDLVAPPAPCGPNGGNRTARVTLHPATYPGFGIREPYPDWTGYEELALDVYSELPGDLLLELRIHDAVHDQTWADRFNRTLVVHPGCNAVRVRLSDVRAAPRGREMDMARIRGVVLFVDGLEEPRTLYLDSFRLE